MAEQHGGCDMDSAAGLPGFFQILAVPLATCVTQGSHLMWLYLNLIVCRMVIKKIYPTSQGGGED